MTKSLQIAKPKPSNIISQLLRLLTSSGLLKHIIVKKGTPKPIETAIDLIISFIPYLLSVL